MKRYSIILIINHDMTDYSNNLIRDYKPRFLRLCFNLFKLANNLKNDNDQHIVKA